MSTTELGTLSATHARRIAFWTGAMFLLAILTYATGDSMLGTQALRAQPDFLNTLPGRAKEMAFAGLLVLTNSVVVVIAAVLLYPLLARFNVHVALAYLCARIAEALLLTGGLIAQLLLLPLAEAYIEAGSKQLEWALYSGLAIVAVKANFFAFQYAMLMLGLGSVPALLTLQHSKLLPSWLALWGVAGYVLLVAGALLELCGRPLGVAFSIPGGLFEIVLGIWLMVKGFRLIPNNVSQKEN